MGYGQRQYKAATWLAHRAAWDEEVGQIPPGLQVLHRCDNRPCHEVAHLFLGTLQDNMRDMVEKDRQIKGSRHPSSKLDEDRVLRIRRLHAAGVPPAVIAAEYGVHRSNISYIVNRKTWAHV